jgi:AcrR family transcriptional regulator
MTDLSSAVPSAGGGRQAQRRRTRKAIVDATIGLLDGGRHPPSVDEIARAAEVSRRTVYLHFPSLDHLLLDATAGALSKQDIDTALEDALQDDDVTSSVEALARSLLAAADATLPLGRQLIRLTLDPNVAAQTPRRGYRRTEWIERALEPVRPRLSQEQFARLVSALSVVLGWEAMIVLRDVRGLDPIEESTTVVWAARALVEAMLAESDASSPAASAKTPAATDSR